MLKTKLNVLTLRKEPLPTVIFHEPEAIELCTTTPLMKTRTHTGCKVLRSRNWGSGTTVGCPMWLWEFYRALSSQHSSGNSINCYYYYKVSASKNHWAFLIRNFGLQEERVWVTCHDASCGRFLIACDELLAVNTDIISVRASVAA